MPAAQDAPLFGWLQTLYPIWAELTPEAAYVSAKIGMSELLLSGCTTVADHLYLFPNGTRLDDTIQAAQELGVRFHPTRGSMSLGESDGGLPPDRVVEREDAILRDTRRLIETYHDPKRHSMLRIGVAPCSPFSVTPDLMRESATLARSYGVRLHTHLAETADEEQFCLERFGRRPIEYAEDLGWVGEDVWFAHAVHCADDEAARMGACGCGVAHCPTSNMRLASGIAPLASYARHGVKVGLGVDGSASNDSSHMLAEARMAMLLQRVQGDATAMTVYGALELATRGGAAVLGRDDIGQLAQGFACDAVAFDLGALGYAGGAVHDPLGALLLCAPQQVDLAVVNGRVRARAGQIVDLELAPLVARHNELARAMVARAHR